MLTYLYPCLNPRCPEITGSDFYIHMTILKHTAISATTGKDTKWLVRN